MTIPGWMYQMAQDHQAELLSEAAEYRRARPRALVRISSRIQHFRPGRRPASARVLGRSTLGLESTSQEGRTAAEKRPPPSPISSVGAHSSSA